ncbi:MAG: flagellar hook-length control protein FliK [Arcobacteraceae bacterium]|nr:flagellar hook-length control protein FliK [Arcobacteraceae bacterium]
MASDILNSELFQTTQTDNKGSVTKSTVETKKEGMSLFDSLLKDTKVKVDSKIVESRQVSTDSNTTTKTLVNKEIQPEILKQKSTIISQQNSENTKSENPSTVQTKVITVDKNSSLQEKAKVEPIKIIPEQKVGVDVVKKDELGTQKLTTGVKNSTETILQNTISVVEKITNETTKEIKQSTEKILEVKVPTTLEKDTVVEKPSKALWALLDKVMQDIKKEPLKIDEKSSKDLKTKENNKSIVNIPTSTIASEIKKSDDKSTTTLKTESLKTEKVLIKEDATILVTGKKTGELSKEEKISSLQNTKSPMQKEEIKQNPSDIVKSLLDTISVDSADIEKTNEPKQSEVKNVIKSEDGIGKLFLELTNGIKVESKTTLEKVIQTKKDVTKEDKILSSLSDSITGKTKVQKEVDQKVKLATLEDPKGQFGANVFLSNQKVQAELLSKQKLHETKEILTTGENTVKTVKKAAETLDLKANKIEVHSEEESPLTTLKQSNLKSNELEIKSQQSFLNRIFLQKESNNQIEDKVSEIKTAEKDTNKTAKDVVVTVERSLVETFTTKVIASKQAMGSFMSDVARNMYLNYKPPVTAFKINLDPLNLGSITIMMRNNKSENSLSISLNMSQNGTLDTFNDNKSTLQNALVKVFNQSEANISLDFGMQNDNSNQEFEQFRENQENRNQGRNTGGTRNQIITEIEEVESTNIETTKNYM